MRSRKHLWLVLLALAGLFMVPAAGVQANTTITLIDDMPGGFTGDFLSMELDSSNNPIMVYNEPSITGLIAQICDDPSCNTITEVVLDDGGGNTVGAYASLQLAAGDIPVVSYYDQTAGAVKLARCSDAACTSVTVNVVDDGGADMVGGYTALALNSSGNPVIAYYNFDQTNVELAACADATCSGAPTINTVAGVSATDIALVLAASDNPIVAYSTTTSLDLQFCSNPACSVIGTPVMIDAADTEINYLDLELDSGGVPVVSYYVDDSVGGSTVNVNRCLDDMCLMTGAPAPIATVPAGSDAYTSLELNSMDYPIVAYADDGDLMVAVCGDPSCTAPPPTLSTVQAETFDLFGYFADIELTSTGEPVIAHENATRSNVLLAVCDDEPCSAPQSIVIDRGSQGGFFFEADIALTSTDLPRIVYVDGADGEVRMAICTSADCTTKSILNLDTPAVKNAAGFPSLVLDGSDLAVIAQYDSADGNLFVTRCGDTLCTDLSTNAADASANDVGNYASIALDASDFPIISYYDATAGDLKVAQCSDTNCLTTPTINVVDDGGTDDVGLYTQIALDSSGNPVIAYLDNTNFTANVAFCADPDCATATTTQVSPAGNIITEVGDMVLGAGDVPIVTYTDTSNASTSIAVCSDASCSSATINNAGPLGSSSAVALDASGFPIVSYYDLTDTTLNLTQCLDATCGIKATDTVDATPNHGIRGDMELTSIGNAAMAYGTSSGDAVYFAQTELPLETGPAILTSPGIVNMLEGGEGIFKVRLSAAPSDGSDVGVTVIVLEGTDVLMSADGSTPAATLDLTFTAENWFLPQPVTVSVPDNTDQDGPRSAIIGLEGISGAPEYVGLFGDDLEVNITDDDSPGLIVEETEGETQVVEGTLEDTLDISLTVAPAAGETVTLSPSYDTSQISVDPSTLTFDETNWDTPQILTINGVEDGVEDNGATTEVGLESTSSDVGSDYDGLFQSVEVTVLENNTENFGLEDDENGDGLPDGYDWLLGDGIDGIFPFANAPQGDFIMLMEGGAEARPFGALQDYLTFGVGPRGLIGAQGGEQFNDDSGEAGRRIVLTLLAGGRGTGTSGLIGAQTIIYDEDGERSQVCVDVVQPRQSTFPATQLRCEIYTSEPYSRIQIRFGGIRVPSGFFGFDKVVLSIE